MLQPTEVQGASATGLRVTDTGKGLPEEDTFVTLALRPARSDQVEIGHGRGQEAMEILWLVLRPSKQSRGARSLAEEQQWLGELPGAGLGA